MRNALCSSLLCIFLLLTSTGCSTTMIDALPTEQASVGEDAMLSDLRTSCVDRINEVAQKHNKMRRRAKIWSISLGLVGGLGTAVGTISMLSPIDTYVGPPVSAVSALIGAVSSILSPFAPSADDATQLAGKHNALLSTLYQSDMLRTPEQRTLRIELLQRCANAP